MKPPFLLGTATAALHYTTLHYTTLHYTTLHYTTLHYTTLHYTTLHYTSAEQCSKKQRKNERTVLLFSVFCHALLPHVPSTQQTSVSANFHFHAKKCFWFVWAVGTSHTSSHLGSPRGINYWRGSFLFQNRPVPVICYLSTSRVYYGHFLNTLNPLPIICHMSTYSCLHNNFQISLKNAFCCKQLPNHRTLCYLLSDWQLYFLSSVSYKFILGITEVPKFVE